jgi:hypothetical protein
MAGQHSCVSFREISVRSVAPFPNNAGEPVLICQEKAYSLDFIIDVGSGIEHRETGSYTCLLLSIRAPGRYLID